MILKFRAWDKTHSKIIKADDILNLNLRYDEIEYQEICQYGMNPPERDICAGKLMEFVLMQSTGLKDKNGVEIYEGDIVKPLGFASWIGVVAYSKENAACILDSHDNDFVRDTNVYLSQFAEGLEVLGNIYENPELLEVKDD